MELITAILILCSADSTNKDLGTKSACVNTVTSCVYKHSKTGTEATGLATCIQLFDSIRIDIKNKQGAKK